MIRKRSFRLRRRKPVRSRNRRVVKRTAQMVNNRLQTYFFTRKCNFAQIYPANGLPTRTSFTFKLSDLPNYTEFTNLFDQYRIAAVKLTFIPRFNSADINPQSTALAIPRMWYVIDYDDNNTLTDENSAYQYQNCKVRMLNRMFSIYIRPKVATDVYRTLTTVGYSAKRQFIDCEADNVPHYGIKTYVEPAPNDGQFTMTVVAKYYLSFKNVR